ncbi:hypothetical protein H0H93_011575 [Arthromyces matolae]|nr:hypothetical protein H0H93_011575 [Arthromyces matolae]
MNNSKIQTARTETNLEDIQLHVLGSGAQKRELWKMPNAEAFMKVFVDCVERHYHVYKEGGVPPPLTESTLMFEYGGDDNIRGVINDWDIAHDETNGESQLWKAYHPGSIPFMAQDLLVDGIPPPHLYRHDLESFFYILVWAAVKYRFSADRPRKIDRTILGWDAEWAESAKFSFIVNPARKKLIIQHVQPTCSILLPWIDSLWLLFSQAHFHYLQNYRNLPKDWDHTTVGGRITFDAFMEAIGRDPC